MIINNNNTILNTFPSIIYKMKSKTNLAYKVFLELASASNSNLNFCYSKRTAYVLAIFSD